MNILSRFLLLLVYDDIYLEQWTYL